MRRRDFEIVAQAMRGAQEYSHYAEDQESMRSQWEHDCRALAEAFMAQSAAFDAELFLKNCGAVPSPPRS